MKLLTRLLKQIIFSIMMFFSISFITVLFQINSPIHRIKDSYELRIGFPLEYYHEFMVDCPIPNSGWDISNLVFNFVIVWILTVLLSRVRKIKRNF